MSDVKWIKISVDLMNNRKIKQIRKLENGNEIVLVWVFLICLAGATNDGGLVYFTPEMPFTAEMLSTEFDIDIDTVSRALQIFERFGMVKTENGMISISSWDEWQSTDRLTEIREYNRLAKQKLRERKNSEMLDDLDDVNDMSKNVKDNSRTSQGQFKDNSRTCQGQVKDNSKTCQGQVKDKSRTCPNIDIDIDKELDKKRNNYQLIADMYNEICISLPRITSLSDKRRQAIKARLKLYSLDQFREMFEKAEASRFLTGGNDKNWLANFDWLIKDANFAKVLDGNFDDSGGSPPGKQRGYNDFMDELRQMYDSG